jgi:glycerol-1-phosphatase
MGDGRWISSETLIRAKRIGNVSIIRRAPGILAYTATDISHMEGLIPLQYGSDAKEIAGARSLISSLSPLAVPWAIVTSGTRPLVTGWLSILKLPSPEHLVTAEDVENGKPDPTCYQMGLKKLKMEGKAEEVLVLEDSPAGIRAGKAAGCKVLGVVTSHSKEQVVDAGANWVVRDLSSVKVVGKGKDGRGVTLEIRDALVKE